MGNNIIVDVSELNTAIEKINTLDHILNAKTSVINGQPTSSAGTHKFTKTYSLDHHWTSHMENGKHVKNLHVYFKGVTFAAPPTVILTFEGKHDGFVCHVHHVTAKDCDISIVKLNGKTFGSQQYNQKVHLVATGR
jgi:hypothetical protein